MNHGGFSWDIHGNLGICQVIGIFQGDSSHKNEDLTINHRDQTVIASSKAYAGNDDLMLNHSKPSIFLG